MAVAARNFLSDDLHGVGASGGGSGSASGEALEPSAIRREPSSRKATILVIEDDDGVRESLVALLEGGGHIVLEAGDGVKALTALGQHRVDAIVLDLAMPRLDGLAVLEAIGPPPPKVVVYSALEYYTSDQIQRRAVGGSVTRILRKPCPPAELLAAINEAAGTR